MPEGRKGAKAECGMTKISDQYESKKWEDDVGIGDSEGAEAMAGIQATDNQRRWLDQTASRIRVTLINESLAMSGRRCAIPMATIIRSAGSP